MHGMVHDAWYGVCMEKPVSDAYVHARDTATVDDPTRLLTACLSSRLSELTYEIHICQCIDHTQPQPPYPCRRRSP